MVTAMDAVGVDGALLVSPFSLYRYDASYAIQVHAAHPGRFGLIKPVDPDDPAVAETITDWAATPGAVAIRLMLNPGWPHRARQPRRQSSARDRRRAFAARQRPVLGATGPGWPAGDATSRYGAGDRPSRLATAVHVRRSPLSLSPSFQRCWHWLPTRTS